MSDHRQCPPDITALMDHLPHPVLLWTRSDDGFILGAANTAAREITRGAVETLIGSTVERCEDVFPGIGDALARCLADGVTVRREVVCRLPGRTHPRRMVLVAGLVSPDLLALHAEDVTSQREAEEQLVQSQKLEAIGRLAGGIAHDFNNLMTIIIGYTGFAVDSLRGDNPIRDDLLQVRKAGRRAMELTRQLLTFSRRQVLEPDVIDLNAVLLSLDDLLRRLLGEDIAVEFETAGNLDCVMADRGQIEQLLMNLAVNARDAMPRGGRLLFETKNVIIDDGYTRSHVSVEPGHYVMLAVSDTGCGMPPEVAERIFEPFFTTKEVGKGTGLGLSTVYGIVKQAGGNIWVYSEPGLGTTFRIYLPRVAGPAMVSHPPSLDACVSGTETVLLVEDERAVRTLAERILTRAGYLVLSAASGEDALAIAGGMSDKIDLLLTDVVMPGMSGRELAERLSAGQPGLKVLFMSGYSSEMITRHGVLEGDRRLITKPFSSTELLRRVRETIDGVNRTPSAGHPLPDLGRED